MPDYKAMYHKMFNAATDAIRDLQCKTPPYHYLVMNTLNVLRDAQLECEELYINSDDELDEIMDLQNKDMKM